MDNEKKGKIIVIEGTDCSGKATQSKLLEKKLKENGKKCVAISFPCYDTPTGKIVGGAYLGKKEIGKSVFGLEALTLDPKIASLYYAADRKYNIDKVISYVNDGYFVILDRYVTSNLAHQGGKILNKDERFYMYQWIDKLEYWLLELPKPDKTIFLHVPYDFSKELKKNRESIDILESSEEHLKNAENEITLVDRCKDFFNPIINMNLKNIRIVESELTVDMDFDSILKSQEVVYHLVSTTVPTTSNQHISQELVSNVVFSANLFEACIRCGVKKVVFISSGGTVYGKEVDCPLKEKTATNPISSYGVQKVTIEKLLYLYRYMYGLDYRIIRLANPYGPYQRPNGVLGAVTTFTYKALKGDEITVYGDGSIVRDFIYIDDAIRAIMKIVEGENKHRTFNLGCGYGTSIKQVLETIEKALGISMNVSYIEGRKVDVPVNYLDISRYEKYYGALNPISLEEGIKKTADFMKHEYNL